MSLSDTAEYWQDVKKYRENKKVFIHIKNIDCGHYHVIESKNLEDIDCYACKKIIENDPILKEKLEKTRNYKKKK